MQHNKKNKISKLKIKLKNSQVLYVAHNNYDSLKKFGKYNFIKFFKIILYFELKK